MGPNTDMYHLRAITQLAAFFVEHVCQHDLDERLESCSPEDDIPWEEVKASLQDEFNEQE